MLRKGLDCWKIPRWANVIPTSRKIDSREKYIIKTQFYLMSARQEVGAKYYDVS